MKAWIVVCSVQVIHQNGFSSVTQTPFIRVCWVYMSRGAENCNVTYYMARNAEIGFLNKVHVYVQPTRWCCAAVNFGIGCCTRLLKYDSVNFTDAGCRGSGARISLVVPL